MPATALATTALAISMNAQNQDLLSQKEAACGLLTSTYDASKATIEQMKEYANCIHFLYPQDVTSLETLVLKLSIIVILITMCVFGYLGYGKWKPAWGIIEGSFVGFVVSISGLLAIWLLFFAVKFLVS